MRNLLSLFLGLLVATAFVAGPGSANAKEYLLTTTKPNSLVLIDAAARKVVRTLEMPGDGAPMSVVASPDGNTAYVLTNRLGSIVGIDLDSGATTFKAEFSTETLRVRGMFGMDISPDGKEIFVIQSSVKLGKGEYEVQEPRVAVYNTGDGNKAQPVRIFPAPHRVSNMFMSTDGKTLYLNTWDIHAMDPQTGKIKEIIRTANWDRKNFIPPDIFGVWAQYEQAQSFVNPYFTLDTSKDMMDPTAWKTGMLVFDLDTGKLVMEDFEDTAAIIFSSVRNPVRRNEVYGVYTTLSKIDLDTDKLVSRQDLDHTYYAVNISSDGKEIYVGGTMNDIAIYDTKTMKKIDEIVLKSGNDMGISWLRTVQRQ